MKSEKSMSKGKPKTIVLKPIGYVKSKATEDEFRKNRKNIVSKVILEKRLTRALLGIENFSHIYVIYFMHGIQRAERLELRRHPRRRKDLAKVGVLAIREPARPNPIGLTIIELLGRKGNVLKVKGLDALNESPVLDIKPYDHMDVIRDIKVPDWWLSAHSSYALEKQRTKLEK